MNACASKPKICARRCLIEEFSYQALPPNVLKVSNFQYLCVLCTSAFLKTQ